MPSQAELEVARLALDNPDEYARRLRGFKLLAEAGAGREDLPISGGRPELNLIDLRDVRIEPVEWLLVDRLPLGELTIVEGKGGIGKTTMLLDIAARLSRGAHMPDHTPTRSAMVLIIAEEDRRSIIKARLLAAGADLAQIRLVAGVGVDAAFLTLPSHADALLAALREGRIRLVIIDSLFNHFDDDVNAHRPQDVRRALRPLVDAAHATNAAIVGIRHWTKGVASASDRGLGSIDIRNIVRSVLTVAEHPDDEVRYAVAVSKSNLGRPCKALTYSLESLVVEEGHERVEVARIVWGDPADISADELANRVSPATEDASERDAVADFLRDLLTSPKPSQQVVATGKSAGFSRSTLYRAAKRLGVVTTRAGFGGISTWAPPAGPSSLSESSHISQVPESETNGISCKADPTTDVEMRDDDPDKRRRIAAIAAELHATTDWLFDQSLRR